jgi:hypothetical protein
VSLINPINRSVPTSLSIMRYLTQLLMADGRKQALGKKTPQEKLEAGKCTVCGQQNSQKHHYRDCRRPNGVSTLVLTTLPPG